MAVFIKKSNTKSMQKFACWKPLFWSYCQQLSKSNINCHILQNTSLSNSPFPQSFPAQPETMNQSFRNRLKWETTRHFLSPPSPRFLCRLLEAPSRESEGHFPQHAPSLMCAQYSSADAKAVKMTLETISLWCWRYAVLSLTLCPSCPAF